MEKLLDVSSCFDKCQIKKRNRFQNINVGLLSYLSRTQMFWNKTGSHLPTWLFRWIFPAPSVQVDRRIVLKRPKHMTQVQHLAVAQRQTPGLLRVCVCVCVCTIVFFTTLQGKRVHIARQHTGELFASDQKNKATCRGFPPVKLTNDMKSRSCQGPETKEKWTRLNVSFSFLRLSHGITPWVLISCSRTLWGNIFLPAIPEQSE